MNYDNRNFANNNSTFGGSGGAYGGNQYQPTSGGYGSNASLSHQNQPQQQLQGRAYIPSSGMTNSGYSSMPTSDYSGRGDSSQRTFNNDYDRREREFDRRERDYDRKDHKDHKDKDSKKEEKKEKEKEKEKDKDKDKDKDMKECPRCGHKFKDEDKDKKFLGIF
ncbi:hypothetical protein TYRP_014165 [Tyrophagus putrescentiae]|nr:hypothetical protein TYRP_014165 [Tyrophagus putrescentiae]